MIDREKLIAEAADAMCRAEDYSNNEAFRILHGGARLNAITALPVIVAAVTDEVRLLHMPMPLTGLWGDCANGDGECGHVDECPEETRDVCTECDHTVTDEDWQSFKTYPCPTVRLLDAIDKAVRR